MRTAEQLQEYRRQYWLKNRERITAQRMPNREAAAVYSREYYAENRERQKAKQREYNKREDVKQRDKWYHQQESAKETKKRFRLANAERLRVYKSEWHKKRWLTHSTELTAKNKAWRQRTGWDSKHHAEKWTSDPAYKLRMSLRNRLQCAIKNRSKKGSAVALLGCSIEFLIVHLESQFQPGMSWENWSLRGWHIDHKKPLISFDLTDQGQLTIACHYTNLQPLWSGDNLRKGGRVR